MAINLTTTPEFVNRKDTFLFYIEKVGPFMKTAAPAWQEFWSIAKGQIDTKDIATMVGLSLQQEPVEGRASGIYQAGVTLKSKPERLPAGLKLRTMEGRRYARFVLTGSYSQLPQAYPEAFKSLSSALDVAQAEVDKDEFCMEGYLNTPQDTAEDKLLTEILIPIKESVRF